MKHSLAADLRRAICAGQVLDAIEDRTLYAYDGTSAKALPDVVVIAESGIREPADVSRLRAAGLANFLVGEALVRSSAPGALLAELLGTR